MRTVFLLAVLLAAPFARAAAPAADDTARAGALFRSATALYEAGKFREAAEAFEAAYRLRPHGTIHYNVAQCRDRLGEWPAALRAYSDYLREVPGATDRVAVRAAMKRIEGKLAATGVMALLVYTDPPGAEVQVDGRPRGRTPFHTVLPPGPYALALALDGRARVEQEVTIPADVSLALEVVLAPASPSMTTPPLVPAAAPDSTPNLRATPPAAPLVAGAPLGEAPKPVAPRANRRLWTWVAAGAAVAALSAGVYQGLEARDAESKLRDGTFHPDADGLADDAKTKSRTANVLYGVAGAAAAAGVTLFFFEGRF